MAERFSQKILLASFPEKLFYYNKFHSPQKFVPNQSATTTNCFRIEKIDKNQELQASWLHFTHCPLNFFAFLPEKRRQRKQKVKTEKSENNCTAKTSVQLIYASVSN